MASGFLETSFNYKKQTMGLVLVNALFMPTMLFLIGLSTILSIYLGGLMVYDKSISFGAIVAFIFFVNNLTWPFASIGWVTSIIQRASASQRRINEFLDVRSEIVSSSSKKFNFNGKIEFKNVSFTYKNTGIEALNSINFEVNKGETLAIIGKTGSGKSSILGLLMRQYNPTSGQIFIDGKDLKDINIADFRDQAGIVPQEVFLFSDTIGNNLKFGSLRSEIPDDELIEAAKQAHVYNNIEDFPQKFNTILGERGVNLSGGQKQRISLARALIREPALLVLDDCLSAVDTETEEIILSNLKKKQVNRTTIVVSHRISTVRNATKIIVIEKGSIVEFGNHAMLMKQNGIYADMYTKQLADETD